MTRARAIIEEAADAAAGTASRVLRLPTIRGQFAAAADKAGREQLTYAGSSPSCTLWERFMRVLVAGDRRRPRVTSTGGARCRWRATECAPGASRSAAWIPSRPLNCSLWLTPNSACWLGGPKPRAPASRWRRTGRLGMYQDQQSRVI